MAIHKCCNPVRGILTIEVDIPDGELALKITKE